jgi:hypothetical protein
LEDGESCELVEVVEKEGKVLFHHPEPLLLDPCSSSKIGVYKYHRRNTIVKWIPTTEIHGDLAEGHTSGERTEDHFCVSTTPGLKMPAVETNRHKPSG